MYALFECLILKLLPAILMSVKLCLIVSDNWRNQKKMYNFSIYLSQQHSGPTLDIDWNSYDFIVVQTQLQILGELCGWPLQIREMDSKLSVCSTRIMWACTPRKLDGRLTQRLLQQSNTVLGKVMCPKRVLLADTFRSHCLSNLVLVVKDGRSDGQILKGLLLH